MHQNNNNALSGIIEVILKDGLGGLSEAASTLLNEAMRIDRNNLYSVNFYPPCHNCC